VWKGVKREFTGCLDGAKGDRSTFLGVFAGLVVLPEVGIARLVWDRWRQDRRRWRGEGRLARMYASNSLALGDEGPGTFLRDDLEVVGATSVCDVDGRCGPMSEDDGPLLLSHGDVLGVVVPLEAEGIELSLKLVGDGEDEGVMGGRVKVPGAEKGEGLALEESVDFTPDSWSDGGMVGHCEMEGKKRVCL